MATETRLLKSGTDSSIQSNPVKKFPGGYAAGGWLIGLIVLALAAGAIVYLVPTLDPEVIDLNGLTNILVGVAWWLGPISLGVLSFFWTVARNGQGRRGLRHLGALLIWVLLIGVPYAAYLDQGLVNVVPSVMTVVIVALLVGAGIYITFRMFSWVSSTTNPRTFLFRFGVFVLIFGTFIWSQLDPEVLNVILLAGRFALQLLFAIFFAIIQFVAIFWFMSQTKVEVIRPGDPKQVTFADYKGQPNLLRVVTQWINLLSDRGQFTKMGGRFINGILLYGPPGTGKTLLAKCMAGEAGVAFLSIEGSGFRAMFWGVDVLRMIWFVRKARNLAREYGACIAYIDEIDAVGMSRGGVMGGGGQVGMGLGGMFGGGSGALTRLLYEMDGIGEQTRWEKLAAKIAQLLRRPAPARNWHVLFMGSTNRPDVLDPALVRPGRFDQIIQVDPPDQAGRREIIKYYLDKIQTDDTINVEDIVSDTIRATPATIMSAITKTAVRIAMFNGRSRVSQRDIELAFQEQFLGLENPIEEMEETQRQQIAYHEAGHAVAQYHLMPEERIAHVTIKRRGDALGYVMPVPNFEVYAQPLQRYMRDIMVSMGGHVATKLFLGEYWTGATGDFVAVRANLARLAHYGYFGPPVKDPVLIGLDKVDSAPYERIWRELEDQTERLLRAHAAEVEAIAKALLDKGDMSGREVVDIIRQTASRNGHQQLEAPSDLVALPARIVDEVLTSNAEAIAEPMSAESEPQPEQPSD